MLCVFSKMTKQRKQHNHSNGRDLRKGNIDYSCVKFGTCEARVSWKKWLTSNSKLVHTSFLALCWASRSCCRWYQRHLGWFDFLKVASNASFTRELEHSLRTRASFLRCQASNFSDTVIRRPVDPGRGFWIASVEIYVIRKRSGVILWCRGQIGYPIYKYSMLNMLHIWVYEQRGDNMKFMKYLGRFREPLWFQYINA